MSSSIMREAFVKIAECAKRRWEQVTGLLGRRWAQASWPRRNGAAPRSVGAAPSR